MIYQSTPPVSGQGLFETVGSPLELEQIAVMCESARPSEQHAMIQMAIDAAQSHLLARSADDWSQRNAQARQFAATGAVESAVLAIMPPGTVYTGGCLADGSIVAQVRLDPASGAHSRLAGSLAMGWLAALLRALAATDHTAPGARP